MAADISRTDFVRLGLVTGGVVAAQMLGAYSNQNSVANNNSGASASKDTSFGNVDTFVG